MWTSSDLKGKTVKSKKQAGFINNRLVYLEIEAVSDINFRDPFEKKSPIFDQWEALLETARAKAPPGFTTLKQTSGFAWVWMPSERAFVSSAIQGIIIAMLFSYGVLLLATRNIIQASLSLLCVSIIIVSVVAIM